MLVRLLVPRATPFGPESIGDEINVPDDEALRMIKAEQAEIVQTRKTPEKAVKRPKARKAKK